jgi:hypothetical protein
LDAEDLPVSMPRLTSAARRPWEGTVSLTSGYDSNPNLLSEDLLLPVPQPGDGLVSGDTSDSVSGAELEVTYRPAWSPGGWSLGIDLRGGGSLHQDLDYLNLGRAGAVFELARRPSRRLSLLLSGGAEELWLDGASYLQTLDAGASLTYTPTQADATRVDLLLHDRRYASHELADRRRDGSETRIGVTQTRALGRPDRYVALGVAVAVRSADPEFERTSYQGSVEVALPLAQRWSLTLFGAYDKEDFEHRASNLFSRGPARQDRTWEAAAVLSFSFSERLEASLRAVQAERSSNVDLGANLPDLDYRRTMLTAGLSWGF